MQKLSSKTTHAIEDQPQLSSVVAVEVRREYVTDWQEVVDNPMRFIRNAVEGFQKSASNSWSRRYFLDRKQASPETSSSFHCFIRVDTSEVEKLLVQSGQHGVFLTPKAQDNTSGEACGKYRIVWLETKDMSRAMSIHRANNEALGLCHGRASLGLRVRAQDYGTVRKRVDPHWDAQGIQFNVAIEKKFTMAPLPPTATKATVQKLIDSLQWHATPIRQMGGSTWLVGAEACNAPPTDTVQLGNHLVLITEFASKKPLQTQDVVVAGPAPLRKAVNQHLVFSGCSSNRSAINSVSSTSAPSSVGPTRLLVGDLKTEMENKFQAMKEEFHKSISGLGNRIEVTESSVQERLAETREQQVSQNSRLDRLEQGLQQVADNVVTKVDLTAALQTAMEQQGREIRSMLAKRTPEVTPSHDIKSQKTG